MVTHEKGMTESWTDISYEGKALRRNFKIIEAWSKKEAAKKAPDMDKFVQYTEAMSRTAQRHAKLIEIADSQPRLKNLEKLIEAIPAHVLAETKARLGM